MKKTKLVEAFDEWQTALQETYVAEADVIPQGWLSRQEIAKKFEVSDSRADEIIKRMIAGGKLETKRFRLYSEGRRGLYQVPYFKLQK